MTTFKDHFSANAGGYAAFRPDYPPELFAYLAGQVQQRERAWDCATGNGQAARGLAPYFSEVLGSDASAAQIEQALPHAGVRYRVAPAEQSGLEAASVDLVTVAQAAHWFDLPRFYREVERVLRPGGVLALWCYERLRITPEIDAVIATFYGDTLGPYWPPERRWVETGYRDLPFPVADMPTPSFSMGAAWTRDQLLGYFATWSALQAYRRINGHDPLPALRDQLIPLWPDEQECKPVEWPLTLRLGRM